MTVANGEEKGWCEMAALWPPMYIYDVLESLKHLTHPF